MVYSDNLEGVFILGVGGASCFYGTLFVCLYASQTHSGEHALGKVLFRNTKYRLIVWIKFCLF